MRKELLFKTAEGVALYGVIDSNDELIKLESDNIPAVRAALQKDLHDSNFATRNMATIYLTLLAA